MSEQSRLILLQVDATTIGNELKIVVTLSLRGEIYKAEKIANEDMRYEATALATLDLINKLLPEGARLELIEAKFIVASMEKLKVYVVIVEFLEDVKSEYVSGSCIFSETSVEVPAKAILNAVNRRLGKYL